MIVHLIVGDVSISGLLARSHARLGLSLPHAPCADELGNPPPRSAG